MGKTSTPKEEKKSAAKTKVIAKAAKGPTKAQL